MAASEFLTALWHVEHGYFGVRGPGFGCTSPAKSNKGSSKRLSERPENLRLLFGKLAKADGGTSIRDGFESISCSGKLGGLRNQATDKIKKIMLNVNIMRYLLYVYL